MYALILGKAWAGVFWALLKRGDYLRYSSYERCCWLEVGRAVRMEPLASSVSLCLSVALDGIVSGGLWVCWGWA